MARHFDPYDPERDGYLEIEEDHSNSVIVYFVPPKTSMINAGLEPNKALAHRVRLLDFNGQGRCLTIYPTTTWSRNSNFLKPKYRQVECITLLEGTYFYGAVPTTPQDVRDILEDLPSTFIKDYAYGLGLTKPYRFIIDAVEALSDCTEIIVSEGPPTRVAPNDKVFFISRTDFEKARLALNRISNHTQSAATSVKTAEVHNILADRLGLPKVEVKTGRHPYRKLFTAIAEGKEPLSKDNQNLVLDMVRNHAKEIATKQLEKFAKLQNDIELVTLEVLIKRYADMLDKKLNEYHWQVFFNENRFVLNLAFGYPLTIVQDQASVGGRGLSGTGEKITDFLVKNSLTNNTAIFEIKTPQAGLLKKQPLRKGVYTPSAELSGAINQTLDQRHKFQREIAQIKDNSRVYDIESYSVQGCLIIGTTPTGDDQQKSFELFRGNSKDVEIVTFDELLEKLKQLQGFLASEEPKPKSASR